MFDKLTYEQLLMIRDGVSILQLDNDDSIDQRDAMCQKIDEAITALELLLDAQRRHMIDFCVEDAFSQPDPNDVKWYLRRRFVSSARSH